MTTQTIENITFHRIRRQSARGGYFVWSAVEFGSTITITQRWGPAKHAPTETYRATVGRRDGDHHKQGFRSVEGAVRWAKQIATPQSSTRRHTS